MERISLYSLCVVAWGYIIRQLGAAAAAAAATAQPQRKSISCKGREKPHPLCVTVYATGSYCNSFVQRHHKKKEEHAFPRATQHAVLTHLKLKQHGCQKIKDPPAHSVEHDSS